MIRVHRLNGSEIFINSDHIEYMEKTPDTIITLMNDHKYVVKESIPDILDMIVEFNRKRYSNLMVKNEELCR